MVLPRLGQKFDSRACEIIGTQMSACSQNQRLMDLLQGNFIFL